MPTVVAADAPTFELDNAVITGLASPSRGALDTAVWRVRFEADMPSPAHALTREEVFVVLDGALTARFADRTETARAGDALIVPRGEEFSLVAEGGTAQAICALPVGGMARIGDDAFTPPWAE
jgi:mannose-6-phosphate isomerase-like protein (cupin superfamily)